MSQIIFNESRKIIRFLRRLDSLMITNAAEPMNEDDHGGRLKVVFVLNYGVTMAER